MWANPQFAADLVTFTEEILYGKLHFLCSENSRTVASEMFKICRVFNSITEWYFLRKKISTAIAWGIVYITLHLSREYFLAPKLWDVVTDNFKSLNNSHHSLVVKKS